MERRAGRWYRRAKGSVERLWVELSVDRHAATLATGRPLRLTRAGLAPAGSRQLGLAHHRHRNSAFVDVDHGGASRVLGGAVSRGRSRGRTQLGLCRTPLRVSWSFCFPGVRSRRLVREWKAIGEFDSEGVSFSPEYVALSGL